jgi:methylthioribulose 1-phosphate dehydratase/enolase-phosphatase E1
VLHSHSLNAVLATMLDPAASEFSVTHLEMIKVRGDSGVWGVCGCVAEKQKSRQGMCCE